MDLQNKSAEFVDCYAKANPIPGARAKVPLLQVTTVGENHGDGDESLFLCESMVVTEYVAELYGRDSSSSLIPPGREDRARTRLFVELCGSTFSYFNLLRASSDEEFDDALGAFKDGLTNVEAFLKHGDDDDDGPFVLGNRFSLAECTVAPFVQRSCAVLPAFTGTNDRLRVDPPRLCEDLGLE